MSRSFLLASCNLKTYPSCVPFSWLPKLKVMCSHVVLKPQISNCRYSNTWNSIFWTHPSRPPKWTKVLKRQSSWVGCSLRKDLTTTSSMLPAWQRWQSGENTPTVHTYKSFLDIQRSRNHANHLDCTYSHITDQQNSTKRFCSCLVLFMPTFKLSKRILQLDREMDWYGLGCERGLGAWAVDGYFK